MILSVIIVCKNSEKTIKKSIESVVTQSLSKFIELIIIDGASTDRTIEIIESFDFSNLHNFKLVSKEDKGLYYAMNKGLEISRGNAIGFLNSDDYYSNSKVIERIIDALSLPQISVYCGGVEYRNEKNITCRKWIIKEYSGSFCNGWHPAHPGFYFLRDKTNIALRFKTNFKIAADFDFMKEILSLVSRNSVYTDNEIIVIMQLGGISNKSLINILKGNLEILKSFGINKILCWTSHITFRVVQKIIQKKKG